MKKIRTTTFDYQRLIITPTTANGFHYIHYYTSQPKHTSSNTNNCETTLFFMTRFQFFVGWLNLCSRPQVGAINSEDAASKFMRIRDASSLSQKQQYRQRYNVIPVCGLPCVPIFSKRRIVFFTFHSSEKIKI